jgi:hypothetical protein
MPSRKVTYSLSVILAMPLLSGTAPVNLMASTGNCPSASALCSCPSNGLIRFVFTRVGGNDTAFTECVGVLTGLSRLPRLSNFLSMIANDVIFSCASSNVRGTVCYRRNRSRGIVSR